ncbi:MAG TPA: ABC transporter permease [Kiritimatiellia bacterium]|nr:ABC transporter permease [Kiritimatiellia bacterium]HQQ03683.1 ABC transporter permease [Kiritimatiellia bacterium]
MRTVIRANQKWYFINWREIAEYRDLLILLVKRDLTAIYKQTVLGPLWFVIQPLLTTIVFTVIFGNVARIPTDGVPHFIFYMSGTIFWTYFQGVLNHSAASLVGNTNVLSKVYFPRLIIPLSGIFINLAHLALNFTLFLAFFFWFLFAGSSMDPNAWLFLLPVLILQCGLMGLGFGLWVSALTIKYRDLRFALPFIIQLWMYFTPIVYPASIVSRPALKFLLWLNPMTAVVEFSRHAFTGQGSPILAGWGLSWAMTLLVLVSGLFLFNKVQRTFVDTI